MCRPNQGGNMGHLPRVWRALGPAIGPGSSREALRAGSGAVLGLLAVALVMAAAGTDLRLGLYMIAPFGASAVLLFAAPNSPLAQPWSAVVGNAAGALVGVAACLAVRDPGLRIALAVGLAIVAMIGLRAVHPPAGAVAMTAAMNPEAIRALGLWFVLAPVTLGTVMLVALAIAYARATGRHYPFRHFDDPGPHGTTDPPPAERLGLSEAELENILQSYRQSLNLGVEDLARLIGAAQLQAASHARPEDAASIMSRDLVTVTPETGLDVVADLFARHDFHTVPVVEEGDRYLGLICQIDLIRHARQQVQARAGRGRALPGSGRAATVMRRNVPLARPDSPLAALLPLLSGPDCDAVPILEAGRLRGIVTQTDLIAALTRQSLRAG
ncbi:CBS domain-containing protein [Paracoccus limosus]|uniref:CBS domain-containing protein n=2 Tax=Paracoccus limosus TaxID=913252 RepID=A0A844H7A6_9RHOB|nr:CBS domain-containing protein [Paracoccus limosus]